MSIEDYYQFRCRVGEQFLAPDRGRGPGLTLTKNAGSWKWTCSRPSTPVVLSMTLHGDMTREDYDKFERLIVNTPGAEMTVDINKTRWALSCSDQDQARRTLMNDTDTTRPMTLLVHLIVPQFVFSVRETETGTLILTCGLPGVRDSLKVTVQGRTLTVSTNEFSRDFMVGHEVRPWTRSRPKYEDGDPDRGPAARAPARVTFASRPSPWTRSRPGRDQGPGPDRGREREPGRARAHGLTCSRTGPRLCQSLV